MGTAVGLGATGWIPVFEVQFIDFIGPAFNQLVTQVSSLRWRTCGDWSCPMVSSRRTAPTCRAAVYGTARATSPIWAHIHGLKVVIPGTPEDAAGLLWTAIHGPDPTLFLLPKHIFRKRLPYPAESPAVPLGKAAIRREGKDVTVVSWGNCLELADAAAEQVATEGISGDSRSAIHHAV